jgi:riboflavin synthase
MFTGIIETFGEIKEIDNSNEQITLTVSSDLTSELKIDQSVAHNGICLTVTSINENQYDVCAVRETMDKTCIGNWQKGEKINLERGIKLSDRLDGHIVQGHVDTVGKCIAVNADGENRTYSFLFDPSFASLIVEKGSIVINGVSLTCFDVSENSFKVTIIPYTFENTSFHTMKENDAVNLEFDILGKYLQRHLSLQVNRK